MEIIMHFRDFFCKLFAAWRASVADRTWSTAFVTCTQGSKRVGLIFQYSIYHHSHFQLFFFALSRVGLICHLYSRYSSLCFDYFSLLLKLNKFWGRRNTIHSLSFLYLMTVVLIPPVFRKVTIDTFKFLFYCKA